jgi:hypothetical protein
MGRRLHIAALVVALAISVPAWAQRWSSGSAPLGRGLPGPSGSILSPDFGQMNHVGRGYRSGPIYGGNTWSYRPERNHHHRGQGQGYYAPYYGGYYGGYYYPYYYGMPVVIDNSSSLPGAGTFDSGQGTVESQGSGAPTVFENRAPSQYFYRPQVGRNSVLDQQPEESRYGEHYMDGRETDRNEGGNALPEHHTVTANGNENNDATTLLIFKDGTQREVRNYAIMGKYMFLFSGDHRKIPLADINLDATEKANEDRGVEFRVPSSADPS